MEGIFLHYDTPHTRDLDRIVDQLNQGAIIIFPTDTIYALGCKMSNKEGIDRIVKITGKKEKHAKLSLICSDISTASTFTANLDNAVFKMMKRCLPGHYTFILQSSTHLQRVVRSNRKEIGIRIPDNNILQSILAKLDEPLVSTSLNTGDQIQPYYIEPEQIMEEYQHHVDILVDGGLGDYEESTVIDCTSREFQILREGKGDIDKL